MAFFNNLTIIPMKKLKLFTSCVLLLISFFVDAQKLEQYKAINGITYKPTDTVWFGKGSESNAEFLYLSQSGFGAAMTYDYNKGADQLNANRRFQNTFGIIKKIKTQGPTNQQKIVFIVICRSSTRCDLVIDDAIDACEVTPCINSSSQFQPQKQQESVVDQLLKLKSLLDSGAITQAKYDNQKKKILNQ